MTVAFTLATRSQVDTFRDRCSINDVVKYEFDITPWQDDNSVVTSVEWTNIGSGNASIASQALVAGKASAFITFTQSGWNKIKIVLNTATQKKTMWLKVYVVDHNKSGEAGDDYGLSV